MIKRLSEYKKSEIVIPALACVWIIFLICLNISKLNYINILNDEFGYWGTAASIAGYDWKDLMAETPYYSFGYSILLIPIIYLLPTTLWYKTAILLNVLFLVLSYFICCEVGKKIFPDLENTYISLISLLVIIYPGNIIYAQVAWPETLQYFLVWLITYLIVRLEEKFSWITVGKMIISAFYLYCVHNRNIGVIAVLMFCLLLIFIKHNKKTVYFLIPTAFIVGGYFLYQLLKGFEVATLWGNSWASSENALDISASTVSEYIQYMLSNFILFLESLYGKFFYMLVGTGLTVLIAFWIFYLETKENIKEGGVFSNCFIFKTWCILILLVMWALSALRMLDWTVRKDMIVYSRYLEHAMGPVFLLGILYAFTYIESLRKQFFLSYIFVLFGFQGIYDKIKAAKDSFNFICSPVIGTFIKNTDSLSSAFIWIIVTIDIILIGWLWTAGFKRKNMQRVILIVCFFVIFSIEAYKCGEFMNSSRNNFESRTVPIYNQIVNFTTKDIYYIKDKANDEYSVNPKFLQYLIPGHKIHVIERHDIEEIVGVELLFLTNPKDKESEVIIMNQLGADRLEANSLLHLYVVQRR